MLKQFIYEKLTNLTGVDNNLYNSAYLFRKLHSYIRLHKELFGDYENDLMWQPSEDVMHRVSGTFCEFLEREDLSALIPFMELSTTPNAFGRIDELGALYGLQYNTPKLIASLLAYLNEVGGTEAGISILKDGFEVIWRKIVEKENLDVRYDSEVKGIDRKSGANVKLTLQTSSGIKTETCDFLVWAADVQEFVGMAEDITALEDKLLGSKSFTIVTLSLVSYDTDVKYDKSCLNLDNVNNYDHSVIAHSSIEESLVLGTGINRFDFTSISRDSHFYKQEQLTG